MLKEIQFQRSKQRIYAMDGEYRTIDSWECRDAFVPGYNAAGDPRGSLPNGVYTGVTAEVTDGAYGPAYGNFYITTRDPRARDIHGGAVDFLILMQTIKAGYLLTAVCVCKTLTVWY